MSQEHPPHHLLVHHHREDPLQQQHNHHHHHHQESPPKPGTPDQGLTDPNNPTTEDNPNDDEEGGGGGSGDKTDTTNKSQQDKKSRKNYTVTLTEKIKEFCTRADVFAAAHILPVHVICIIVATVIVPISAVSIIWDLLAAVVFQIPNWSTINLPAFVLFINFIAMPVAMYGYMMEFLMHEHSRLALIGLICVVVHPVLFLIRSFIEVYFDGFRGEEKVYFEAFKRDGPEAKYPIGIIRYRQGAPYSDSEKGKNVINGVFGDEDSFGTNIYEAY